MRNSEIVKELRRIHSRLDDIERHFIKFDPSPCIVPESELFKLPDHLRKSYMVVAAKGKVSASDVAIETGRCRALESSHLNQLARMGWLHKERKGRPAVFSLLKKVQDKA